MHRERPFFGELIDFMISGPIMVQVLEGENAVERNREVMGATNPAEASPGTLRADFASEITENAVHGSDAAEERGDGDCLLLRPRRDLPPHPLRPSQMERAPIPAPCPVAPAGRPDALGASRRDWERALEELGGAPYRAGQIMKWIYHRDVRDFDRMTDLRKDLRARLSRSFGAQRPAVRRETLSKDGTRKWLFELDEGNSVETVYIPDPPRGTLCVSSQVGCALNCSFCATARQGFNRNLGTAEIIGQLHAARSGILDASPGAPPITNVVFMGMGEPLLNFDNVARALEIMLDDCAFGLARKRVTLSTAGVVPGIRRLKERCPVSLAVSLHAPDDELRDALVPLNRSYPIGELLDACREYACALPRERITFEYVMLDRINDSLRHARHLVRLLRDIPAKVNLIPFNSFPGTEFPVFSARGDGGVPQHPARGRGDDHHPQDPGRGHRRRLRTTGGPGRSEKPAHASLPGDGRGGSLRRGPRAVSATPPPHNLDEVAPIPILPGPGEQLRTAREAAGMSVHEISTHMHLDSRIILALEADDYEELPAPTFVRGYLRGYARLLDLAPEPVLQAFEQRDFAPPSLVADIAVRSQVQSRDFPIRLVTYVVVAALVLLVVLWWRSQDFAPVGFDLMPAGEPAPFDPEAVAPAGEPVDPEPGVADPEPEAALPRRRAGGIGPGGRSRRRRAGSIRGRGRLRR